MICARRRIAFAMVTLLVPRRQSTALLSISRGGESVLRSGSCCRPCNSYDAFTHTTSCAADTSQQHRKEDQSNNTIRALRTIHDDVVQTPSNVESDKDRKVSVSIKTEDLGGRQRRISGSILIPASHARVWKVLTAYDKIEDYMPNIVSSRVRWYNGQLFLDQTGIISRKLRLTSQMLFEVQEDFQQGTISFIRVEGRDFLEFIGKYFIFDLNIDSVRLDYEVVAMPFPLYPMSLVENKTLKEVPKMLAGIRDEAVLGKYVPDK